MPPVRKAVLLAAMIAACGCGGRAEEPAAQPAADPMADEVQNIRLVGHNDLQGRESLLVAVRSDEANGNWAYVGHHENFYDETQKLNPMTGKMEWNGTSILDVNDPANPRLVWHIPNDNNASSRSVSVVYDYKFDGSGRDYLIRNSEYGDDFRFQIFDITSRTQNPEQISLVSEITATPENSCGRGCGGKLIGRAHKGWWSQESGYFYSAAGEPGFRTTIAQIWDLKDPKQPRFVGRMWIPGQKDGEPGNEGQYAHHPNVDEQNKRIYIGYREAGWTAAFDIANPAQPKRSGRSTSTRRTEARTPWRRSRTTGSRTSARMRCPAPMRWLWMKPALRKTLRPAAVSDPRAICSTSRTRRGRYRSAPGRCPPISPATRADVLGPTSRRKPSTAG